MLGAEKQQIRFDGILLDHVNEVEWLDVHGDEAGPRVAIIGGSEDVGRVVAPTVIVEGHEGRAALKLGRLDVGHPSVRTHAFDPLHHVGPGAAAVTRQLHVAVVSADPEHPALDRRRRDSEDGGVVFRFGVVAREPRRIGPCICFSGSLVVRSGLRRVQVVPMSVLRWTNWLPK